MPVRDHQIGYALTVAVAAGGFGATAGWFLPLLVQSPGPDLFAARAVSLSVGATIGFIVGGGLAARYAVTHLR